MHYLYLNDTQGGGHDGLLVALFPREVGLKGLFFILTWS